MEHQPRRPGYAKRSAVLGVAIVNRIVPTLLLNLLQSAQWQHPGDEVLVRLIPLLEDPVDFRQRVPGCTVAEDFHDSFELKDWENFRLYRSGEPERPLPWLNADQAVFIAVNRFPGDDVGIALDYRQSEDNPKVVASYWRENKHLEWFEVASSFEAFVKLLGIVTT